MSAPQLAIYTLAHDLGQTVTQMARDMPLGELYGWSQWYRERNKRQQPQEEELELSEMSPEQVKRFFG